MSTSPPPSLPTLQSHLSALLSSSPPPLDTSLITLFTASLTPSNSPSLIPILLPPLSQLLHSLTVDPAPIATLLITLLSPVPLSTLSPSPSDLSATLTSPSPAIQSLGLTLCHKAASSTSETDFFTSNYPTAHTELLHLALSASITTSIAESAKSTITAIFSTDVSGSRDFAGRLWSAIPEIKSYSSTSSISQSRLLALLQDLSIVDFSSLSENAIELLKLATEKTDDIMLRLLQFEWAAEIIAKTDQRGLNFLRAEGVVEECFKLISTDEADDIEVVLLGNKAAEVVVAYVTTYPQLVTPVEMAKIKIAVELRLVDPDTPHAPTLGILAALGEKTPRELVAAIPMTAAYLPVLPALLRHKTVLDLFVRSHGDFWTRLINYGRMSSVPEVSGIAWDVVEAVAEADVEGLVNAPGVLGWLVERIKGDYGVVCRREEVVQGVVRRVGVGSQVGLALRESLRGEGGRGEARADVASLGA